MASQEPGSTRTTARGREPAGATRERLFAAFEPASHEAWRAEAERLLRGAPFDRRMRTRTVEGITLEPIYHREDLAGLAAVGSMPGETPFLRGASVLGNRAGGWRIAQELDRPLAGTATGAATGAATEAATGAATGTPAGSATPNAALRAALARGQNAIWVGSDALDSLLEDIDPAAQPLFIRARAGDGAAACELLETVARRHGIDLATLDGAIVLDPLGALAASGSLARSLDACFADLAATTVWAARHTPRLGSVWVDGTPYHDGGGSAVEELAFTIATGIESLRRLETHGVDVETAATHLRAGLSVGSVLFMEIAKLRAARLLWSRVLAACGVAAPARGLVLHARTSRYTQTLFDRHVNLLRATTQALAAVVGGADSIHVEPFDAVTARCAARTDAPGASDAAVPAGGTDDADTLAERLARNIQLVLRDEAHLDAVIDPAGGSWYVERLTAELAGRAWELVREVERRGGMARALEAGFPQDRVARTAAERGGAVATRRTVIVGTNQYADAGEEIAIDAGGAARPSTAGDGDRAAVRVRPVAPHRAAEGFEALRLAVGAHRRAHGGGRVFVATLGQVARYMPRLDFTTGFFVSGGFEVERGPGFDTPQAAAAAALADAGEIIVLCGLDATYDDQAQPVARAVRDGDPRRILLLAGQPADDTRRAALEAAGIEGFIHARSNVLEVLSGLAAQLGVRAAAAPAVAATDDPEGGAS